MPLYHGTCEALAPSILKKGLIPQGGKGCDAWALQHTTMNQEPSPKGVYLATSKSLASSFAELCAQVNKSKPCLFEVDNLLGLRDDLQCGAGNNGEMDTGRGFYYPSIIPPIHLKGPLPPVKLSRGDMMGFRPSGGGPYIYADGTKQLDAVNKLLQFLRDHLRYLDK